MCCGCGAIRKSPHTGFVDQLLVVSVGCDFFFALAVLVAVAVVRFDRCAAGCFFGSVFFAVGWAFVAVRRGFLAGAAVNRLVQKLGLLPIRLHDLRQCAATLSLAAGVHMKAIQVLLGPSSFKLTADTYTSVLPQLEVEAADAPVALVPRKAAQQGGQGGDEPPQGPQLVPTTEPTASPTPAAPRSSDAAGAEVHPMVGRTRSCRRGARRIARTVVSLGRRAAHMRHTRRVPTLSPPGTKQALRRSLRGACSIHIAWSGMVPPAGFEPATPALGERCSIP